MCHEYSVRRPAAFLHLGTNAFLAASCSWQVFCIYIYIRNHTLPPVAFPWPCALTQWPLGPLGPRFVSFSSWCQSLGQVVAEGPC